VRDAGVAESGSSRFVRRPSSPVTPFRRKAHFKRSMYALRMFRKPPQRTPEIRMQLYQVEMGSIRASLDVEDNVLIRAGPMLKNSVGLRISKVKEWVHKKGGRMELVSDSRWLAGATRRPAKGTGPPPS